MKCPFCGEELEDGLSVCTYCNQPLTAPEQAAEEAAEEAAEAAEEAVEETVEEAEEAVEAAEETAEKAEEKLIEEVPAKKDTPAKKKFPLLAVIFCALAACAAIALIIFGPKLISAIKERKNNSEETTQTQESDEPDDSGDEEPDSRMQDVVVTCGDSQLTNGEMQILYRIEYQEFMQYAPYYAMYGMEVPDESLPMSEQIRSEDGLSWEQYFLNSALDFAGELLAAKEEGNKNGFALSEEEKQSLDAIPGNLAEEATAAGYDSALAYTQANYGKSVSDEDFLNVYSLFFYANAYEQSVYNSLECTDEEVDAFYENNPDAMTSNGVSKVAANVRHILFKPADEDGDGTSTEEEWAAAEKQANEIFEEYKKDPTEDHFAELAGEHTQDPGSAENGGLYENVIPGQMVTPFNDWIFDETRKEGDSGIVKTEYGYHIMYYISVTESDTWFDQAKELLLNDMILTEINAMIERNPITVENDKIVIAELPKAEEQTETQSAEDTASVNP